MTTKKLFLVPFMLLMLFSTHVWAWDGNGTESDPYLVKSDADWNALSSAVSKGDGFSGKVFRMTDDIDVHNMSVGTEQTPFAGTFDGDGHMLTFNVDNGTDHCGPFLWISGATIQHLRTTGKIVTGGMYAAGIVSMVVGNKSSQLYDCQSDISIWGAGQAPDNAAHGGLVGAVASGGLTIEKCLFKGYFSANNSAGMVGWTNVDVTITNCMVSPEIRITGSHCATFYRKAGDATVTLDRCYYTNAVEPEGTARQGEGVFSKVVVPEGCSCEIESAPDVYFGGESYWKSGAWVTLTAPDNVEFDHWFTGIANAPFVSDPWTKNGSHQILDVNGDVYIQIQTSMPYVSDKNFAELNGVKYRYLSKDDYHLYVSNEECQNKGWYIDEEEDGKYLCVKDKDGTEYYVTAIVGYNSNSSSFNQTLGGRWAWDDNQFTGTLVPVDLLATFTTHTHVGVIAPRAFKDCSALKRLVFISEINQDEFHHNDLGVDFAIGNGAFANCPNLESVVMMYYNYTGNDHWDVIKPDQIPSIASDAFSGSPNARILVDPSVYQDYLSSDIWKDHQQRIGLYMSAEVDMTVNGAKYGYMRNSQGKAVKNDAEGHEAVLKTINLWNADYQQFSSTSLLAEQDYKNIWYAQVVGADADYLKSHDGVMRIYNDPGSYYNYKTLSIAPNAFSGCNDLRVIEFWQTNGRSENSYTDLKMVIPNGAFAHCDSLKELRMYYYVQDGTDHWETLGPKDVIPGDNIFGVLEDFEGVSMEEYKASSVLPVDFRIVVSPARYQEFIDDPNWAKYASYIVASDYEPTDWSPINEEGLTYDYAAKTVNTASTNQVVTQNLSWWNLPIKIFEVINLVNSAKDAFHFAVSAKKFMKNLFSLLSRDHENMNSVFEAASEGLRTVNAVDRTKPETFSEYFRSPDRANQCLLQNGQAGREFARRGLVRLDLSDRIAWVDGAKETIMNDRHLFDLFKKGLRQMEQHQINLALTRDAIRENFAEANRQLARFWELWGEYMVSVPAMYSAYGIQLAMVGEMSSEQFQHGLVENIKANIHNVSYENTFVYTPDKKLIYHVYVDKPYKDQDSITIYNDIGRAYNYRTVGIKKQAFQGNQTLRRVGFAENAIAGSDSYVPMQMAIPDSAFANCKNLERFNLIYKTRNGGWRGMGPENFVLGGDSIFAGCDPEKFKIVIDQERKEDFLEDEIWKHYQRYFIYTDVTPETPYSEYGVKYAYYYDNNTTQRVSRVEGHKIEHMVAVGADDNFLNKNQGSMGLYNDIGQYNNFKLDEVRKRAFKGNQAVRAVSFWDVKGGDAYTDLDMNLGDSCFVNCTNLANIDMLYCVTDGADHIDLLRPTQVRAGKGMFDGTDAKIKMMPEQESWFEADSAWSKYKDRFMPCIIHPADEGVKAALKEMCYYTPCSSPYRWKDYIDLARIGGAGFDYLNGRFTEQKNKLKSFADFKYFETVGLDYVGSEWFKDCGLLSNIILPSTIRTIGNAAFENCGKLQEIELPASVEAINDRSFLGCSLLQTIVVRGETPASITSNSFPRNEGMKIYVPNGKVQAYKQAWADFAQYIVGESENHFSKHVTTTKKGELAEKLGLYAEISYSGLMYGDEMLCLHGNYSKYDSLTISGPLDDLDLSVIRYLAGSDSYYSKGGRPTDGKLRYLDLSGAQIREGSKYNYVHLGYASGSDRYAITKDNEIPRGLFYNCSALETLILPRSIDDVRIEAFWAPNLKRIAFTNDGDLQYNHLHKGFMGRGLKLLKAPLEELVFLTGKVATSATKDPWGQTIKNVYTYKSQLGGYSGHDDLSKVSNIINTPFDDDAVTRALANKELYFPTQYLVKENVENIFSANTEIIHFNDFWTFRRVKTLDETFSGCSQMKSISLPSSLTEIGHLAFSGCSSLDSIFVSCDSVPLLAQNAFEDLPDNFRIYVPKNLIKRYREKWAQYADHIALDEEYYAGDKILEVTVTEPNTLYKALGLEMEYKYDWSFGSTMPKSMSGAYNHITKLKVNGPISGGDLALIRHLAGYTPWLDCRNYLGHLEYLDLYDAQLVKSDYEVAPDKLTISVNIFDVGRETSPHRVDYDNFLPKYAFLKCYSLKTLILPRTCTEVNTRAMQECEDLETLVIGENMKDFNWDALDDCASMVRLFILTPKKLNITSEFAVWRWLCNNYNPTFDAFYVRPSLYEDYAYDSNYTGSSWQRTNNISKGIFSDDATFCVFGSHAAATIEDLLAVRNVKGWFNNHRDDIKDLTPLRYTSVDSLRSADLRRVSSLEKIAMPHSLTHIDNGIFDYAENLRYTDFSLCDTLANDLRVNGLSRLGIKTNRTLVYVPNKYGKTDEANVIVADTTKSSGFYAKTFHLEDNLDYCVPYGFETENVENTRTLTTSAIPYSVCVPYKMKVPLYSRAYQLDSRDGNTLTFVEVKGELEALKPYLIKVVGNKRFHKNSTTLNTDIVQDIPSSITLSAGQMDAPGYTIRGTLQKVNNSTAAELGAYILQNDGDWHPVSSLTDAEKQAYIPAYRAYLLPSVHYAKVSMNLIDDDTSDIDTIRTIDSDGTERYYDLNGRELNDKPQQGVYIYQGKKYVNK